jgi:hypothetical protein
LAQSSENGNHNPCIDQRAIAHRTTRVAQAPSELLTPM